MVVKFGERGESELGERGESELRRLTLVVGPYPEDVLVVVQVDPDRGVDGLVAGLAVADLDHDRVDPDRGVGLLQWP